MSPIDFIFHFFFFMLDNIFKFLLHCAPWPKWLWTKWKKKNYNKYKSGKGLSHSFIQSYNACRYTICRPIKMIENFNCKLVQIWLIIFFFFLFRYIWMETKWVQNNIIIDVESLLPLIIYNNGKCSSALIRCIQNNRPCMDIGHRQHRHASYSIIYDV